MNYFNVLSVSDFGHWVCGLQLFLWVEELKKRIAKLEEGDAEAIPSVFEAILQRYLSGKHEEGDSELMKEILGKGAESADNIEDEEEFDGDWEETSEADEEDEEFESNWKETKETDEGETQFSHTVTRRNVRGK